MTDSDAINVASDGIEIELADGRTVRPIIRDTDTDEQLRMTRGFVKDEYAKYATSVDNDGVYIWFEEVDYD